MNYRIRVLPEYSLLGSHLNRYRVASSSTMYICLICLCVGTLGELTKRCLTILDYVYFKGSWKSDGVTVYILMFWTYVFGKL